MGRPIEIPDKKKPKESFVMIGIYPKTRIQIKNIAKETKLPIYKVVENVVNYYNGER